MSLLPAGYDSGACRPVETAPDALATVDCDKNSKPGGPEIARYSLFPDKQTLDAHFDGVVHEEYQDLMACPGFAMSPTNWHFESTPDKTEGQVACGTYQGSPHLAWTRDSDLTLADSEGPDITALHQWWVEFG